MRLAVLRRADRDVPSILDPSDAARGYVPLEVLAGQGVLAPGLVAGDGLLPLLRSGVDAALSARLVEAAAAAPSDAFIASEGAAFAPPFRHPRMVWGIGLNYLAHARDLEAPHPTEPASFIKLDHTIVGAGDDIVLPPQSLRVTAEAELGLVIGRPTRDVTEEEALDHIGFVVCVLDQTAEDILQRNPRFLTRSKNFPSFLSFGPELVSTDEVRRADTGLNHIEVATWRNGEVHRANVVSDMAFDPARLVAFHSQMMPLLPGDLILTGTPGAAVVEDGDVAESRVAGVGVLRNPVVRRVPATA